MTSRKSSGSMRVESAVEPTRSANITVAWRRSASSRGLDSDPGASWSVAEPAPASWGNRPEQSPANPKKHDAKLLLEILVREVPKDRKIDPVFGKAVRILGQPER